MLVICQLCKRKMENNALLDCQLSHEIWKMVPFGNNIQNLAEQSMLIVLQAKSKNLRMVEIELLVVFWSSWHARNLFLFESKKVNPMTFVAKDEAILNSFKGVKIPSSNHLEN